MAWQGRNFRMDLGFGTGLNCATQLANVYLSALDHEFISTLGANCLWLARYIDVLILAVARSKLQKVTEALNA